MDQAASLDPKPSRSISQVASWQALGTNLRRTLRELEINMTPADGSEGPVVDPDGKGRINEAEGVATPAF